MSYQELTLNQPLYLKFKEVQITVGIVGTLLSSNVETQIAESNNNLFSEYFISNGNNHNAFLKNSSVLKSPSSATFELDSYGIKQVEIANTEVIYSYKVAERFIEFKENTVSVPKEGISMYEKLLTHRTNTENYGFIIGGILGISTLLVPIFSEVQFLATVPAVILFLSVPFTVLYRRKLNKEDSVH